MEAARGRVAATLEREIPRFWESCGVAIAMRDAFCGRLVAAVLGHPDGKAPTRKRKPSREAQRVAHLPRRLPR